MKYTTLGTTGIKVSKICLGTMTWGRQNTLEEGHQQMNYALDQGVQFWDVAEMYPVPFQQHTYGDTERIIGEWFTKNKKREEVVLATKIIGPAPFFDTNRSTPFASESIVSAIDASLERLQTDYIDLYQLHWPERNTNYFGKRGYQHDENDKWQYNFNRILETLGEAVKAGKIRHIGLSNETPWGIMRFLEEHKSNPSLPRIQSVQNPYSLLNRTYEVGNAEVSIRENVGLLAYSPMAFGLLSGKYHDGSNVDQSRITLFPNLARYSSELSFKATQQYLDLAKEYQLSLAQMALAYVNTRPFLTSNIIGATSMEQLKENISSIDVELPDELIEKIEAIHEAIPNPAP